MQSYSLLILQHTKVNQQYQETKNHQNQYYNEVTVQSDAVSWSQNYRPGDVPRIYHATMPSDIIAHNVWPQVLLMCTCESKKLDPFSFKRNFSNYCQHQCSIILLHFLKIKKTSFFTFSWNYMPKDVENVIKVSEWLCYWLHSVLWNNKQLHRTIHTTLYKIVD